jgi:hypothetical protein
MLFLDEYKGCKDLQNPKADDVVENVTLPN